MTGTGILFVGDPHGEWGSALAAFAEHLPAAVVIMGDCGLVVPFRVAMAPIIGAGVPIWWIPGNHDTDSDAFHDHLWGDYLEGNLHGRRALLDGRGVAGMGGIYRGRSWYPREGQETAVHATRDDLLAATRKQERWRGGLPRGQRDTILPEDHAALRRVRAQVLAVHEAPTSHRHGFGAIDDLARDIGADIVVHGHHHVSYDGETRDGIRVKGLAKAEPWLLTRDMLP